MKKNFFRLLILSLYCCHLAALEVASFHPILSDFARQIGGEQVNITEIIKPGAEIHHFSPRPDDIKKVTNAKIVLFAGKNLETYQDSVVNQLSGKTLIVEAGKYVPSLVVSMNDELFVCCPAHSAGALDPHWWHSIQGSKRACQTIYKSFAEADSANKKTYLNNLKNYLEKLEELDQWAIQELDRIPQSERYLVTAHSAFAYFCRDFKFKSMPILGLTDQENPSPEHLQEVISEIRNRKIKVLFPEIGANPKWLNSIKQETGVILGTPLKADAPAEGQPEYILMIQHNVNAISSAFTQFN